MRTIKFRAWNKSKKIMIEDVSFIKEYVDKLIYLQFTGLLDKNGKEIYEGDILEFDFPKNNTLFLPTGKHIESVKWCDIDCRWEVFFEDFNYGIENRYIGKGVVIGNIYENKELLK